MNAGRNGADLALMPYPPRPLVYGGVILPRPEYDPFEYRQTAVAQRRLVKCKFPPGFGIGFGRFIAESQRIFDSVFERQTSQKRRQMDGFGFTRVKVAAYIVWIKPRPVCRMLG